MIYCRGCNSNLGFIADLTYRCHNHEDFRKGDYTSIMRTLSVMSLCENVPRSFLKKIIFKIEEVL